MGAGQEPLSSTQAGGAAGSQCSFRSTTPTPEAHPAAICDDRPDRRQRAGLAVHDASAREDVHARPPSIGLGYIPSVVFDYAELPPDLVIVPEDLTYITYAFLHGDIFHLGGNMLFLWVFGDNVEDALGHVRFLIFYLLCAVAGALAARPGRARSRRCR